MGIRMMQYLAKGEDEAGRRFLTNARGVFIGLATAVMLAFVIFSPWLPGWFKFVPTAGTGSLPVLFMLGGVGAALLIVNGYFANLNSIYRNLVWPIIPSFFLTQFGMAGQWLLARQGAPLWGQYSMILMTSLAAAAVGIYILKISHAWLGDFTPIKFNPVEVRKLASTSFWVYLCALGNMVYVSTDQILVNAGFGSDQVPAYRFNYKLCELTVVLLGAASYVAMPIIVQRLLSKDDGEKSRGLGGLLQLQKLQAFAGSACATFYLCFNDVFIRVWQGPGFEASLALQTAFAMNLAITIAGDAAMQVRGRLDLAGTRLAGITLGGTGLLNLLLSYIAMKSGHMAGIAAATVVAQSAMSLVMNRSTCSMLGMFWPAWAIRSWLAPLVVVALCALLRLWIAPDNLLHALLLFMGCLCLIVLLAFAVGIRRELIFAEWKQFRRSTS